MKLPRSTSTRMVGVPRPGESPYKDGLPAAENKKISRVHKHCWRYVPTSKGTEESTPKLEVRAA
ncbi:unnamed protein product [Camellia sinensis]